MRTLVLNMHPKPAESQRGRAIVEAIRGLPNVTVRNLAEEFRPGCPESVAKEQELLVAADRIVFLYPVQWYSLPAIGKAYMDEVFCYGFAFVAGPSRFAKLQGKTFRVLMTTGAPRAAYEGTNVLTETCKCVARYAGMACEDPFVFYVDDEAAALGGLADRLK